MLSSVPRRDLDPIWCHLEVVKGRTSIQTSCTRQIVAVLDGFVLIVVNGSLAVVCEAAVAKTAPHSATSAAAPSRRSTAAVT